MSKNASAATTRSATSVRVRFDRARHVLAPAQVVTSPETLIEYRIERLLGEGGFGQVYLATRLGRSPVVPEIVCIKVSARIDGWLREAYVGQVLYCLTLEYARHGDLSAFLSRVPKGWSETTARREIAGILEVLGKLHRGQPLHRDLTPLNVFVCDGRPLKLWAFGIVRQQ